MNNIPTFTPPTPTFTPPKDAALSNGGPVCYYHNGEPAVAKCARCGKYICKDCFDNYGVSDGEYAGKALCYDCCKQLVANNVSELTANKKTIKGQFILMLVGVVIGAILGFAVGLQEGNVGTAFLMALIFAGVGGCFLSFVKFYFATLWEAIKTAFRGDSGSIVGAVLGFLIACIIGIFKCVINTIVKTVQYIVYIKKTSGFIESDSEALRQMEDYMEYTIIRNQNKGVDLETLLNEKSELADNTYAHLVQAQGEEKAEAMLRDCVATINENGEIIRDFAA